MPDFYRTTYRQRQQSEGDKKPAVIERLFRVLSPRSGQRVETNDAVVYEVRADGSVRKVVDRKPSKKARRRAKRVARD